MAQLIKMTAIASFSVVIYSGGSCHYKQQVRDSSCIQLNSVCAVYTRKEDDVNIGVGALNVLFVSSHANSVISHLNLNKLSNALSTFRRLL